MAHVAELDSALEEVGPFGRYQKFLFVLLCITCCLQTPLMSFSHVFLAATPDHWCKVPQLIDANLTVERRKNLSIPLVDDGIEYSKCNMYAVNYSALLDANTTTANTSWPVQNCQYGWEYDRTYYDETIVTEFDLVCSSNQLPSICVSVFYAGGIPGLFLFGWMADRFGRKISLRVVIIGVTLLCLASAFSINFIMYTVFRFAVGIFFPAIYQVPFLIALEMTTTQYRPHVTMIPCILFGMGMASVAGVAYFFRYWKHLIIATSAPFILTFSYWWLIPESPRWLLSKSRTEEAEEIILKTGRINGFPAKKGILSNYVTSPLEDPIIQNAEDEGDEEDANPSVVDLFLWPNIRKKALIVSIIFSINAIVYTGISYMSINLGANDYTSFAVNSLMESPSCLVAWYTMEKWGRRWTICSLMLVVGVVCISTTSVPLEYAWVSVILASAGKFCISATFSVIYVYGTELLPTVIRAAGLGFYSLISTAFVCVSPFIVYTTVHSRMLPMVIMGTLSVLAGFLTLLLPETVGKNLPQTLAEGEEFGKGFKPCQNSCFCSKHKRKRKDVNQYSKDFPDKITESNGHEVQNSQMQKMTTL